MKKYFFILLLVLSISSFAQDTLNKTRLKFFVAGNAAVYGTGVILINELWYKDYNRTNFHWFNDNDEWLQMDKLGHTYTSYYLSKVLTKGFTWTGLNSKKSAIYGSALGFMYISTIEVFDGFSEGWGASPGDLLANFAGSSIFLGQELLWKEQRIIPKFSFHTTDFPNYRPELLGSTIGEQIIKDYNGQTYWLSLNIKSLAQINKFPAWLNIAFGYGATGMTGGSENPENTVPNSDRIRQYYFSLDVDLNRVKTKSKVLKTVFSFINMVKVPFPTLQYSKSGFEFHPLYF